MTPYVTPPGFRDTPFIYVFDPNTLASAYTFAPDISNTYEVTTAAMLNQSVGLQYGEQFILRRINPSFCVIGPLIPADAPGGLKLRDAKRLDRFSSARPLIPTDYDLLGLPMNSSLPICPELLYPVRGAINFDLYGARLRYNVSTPNVDANAVPLSQILFQGVRRYPYAAADNRLLAQGWSERSYIYPVDIDVDWWYWQNGLKANGQSPPQRFTVPISDWDFLLEDIRIVNDYIPGHPSVSPVPAVPEVARIVLYDWAQNALMQEPVNLNAINSANTGGFTGTGIGGTAGAGAQCPPLLYPNRSSIQFDITSMLNKTATPVSHTITIQFVGRRRWPT